MRVNLRLVVKTFKESNNSAPKTARILSIHRSTVYRWIKKARSPYNRLGLSSRNLKRLSTRPKTIHYALSPQQVIDSVKLRNHKGWSSAKIKRKLGLNAHPSTLHRLFKAKKLVREVGYHRRPRYQQTTHMHVKNVTSLGYLQMDVKYITPELSGLAWTCFEYAVIDIYSRYKEAVILNHLDQDGAIAALLEVLPKLPFKPVFIQTDNGLEFQGRFLNLLKELHLKHHFVHKRTPNENAVIERSFRTDEEEFFFYMDRAPIHYDELRDWFATYLREYNHERPHFGIDLKTPAEVVAEVMLH